MNPIQVHCPGCQKLYYVRQEDLSPGEVKFQCTFCTKMFAFDWPVPPEVPVVSARLIQGDTPAPQTGTKVCPACQQKVDVKYTECPKCGIIFDRAKKNKPGDPVPKGATAELLAGWAQVKNNYSELASHESFIQLCLARENLAYASSQYRAILDGNPSDDIANKMQNRIIDLATFTYITAKPRDSEAVKYHPYTKVMMVTAGILVVLGLSVPNWRSMLPMGGSILIFVVISRYWGK